MTTLQLATRLIRRFAREGKTIAAAESCTGGLIAKTLTDVAGSSAVFCGGFVTYTNEAKHALLGVDEAIFTEHTEVSHACAKAMAEGARLRLGTDVAVSTTGFAGPTGGTEHDPVGTVYIAVASKAETRVKRLNLPPMRDREYIRTASATNALALLLELKGKIGER